MSGSRYVISAPVKVDSSSHHSSHPSKNSINIFSIMITVITMWNPLKSIASTNEVFEKFENEHINLVLPKIVYVAANLAVVSVGLYKCWTLGLFPTTPSDWIAQLPLKQPLEFAGFWM
jgi:hypothetical protein